MKIDSKFSMQKRVIINQFKYGPRLPITLLTIPFTNGKLYSEIIQLKPKRLNRKKIERYDVVAYNQPQKFDLPIDKRPLKIGRAIALPGEEILIYRTKVKVNDKYVSVPDPLRFKYRVTCDSINFPKHLVSKYGISNLEYISHPWVYDIDMLNSNEDDLLNEKEILNVRQINKRPRIINYDVYPSNNYYNWNEDNLGPVIVPKKGMAIEFSFKNYYLYRDIIDVHENNRIDIIGEKILCNGKKLKNYTFKQDYYYFLNDNRIEGKDSRYWGFIPINHIVGKALNY
jgi:signal peptidase I